MHQLEAFAEYGRLWMALVNRLGGTHHGYYLPNQDPRAANHGRFSFPSLGAEGPTNIGVAIFSFPDWDAYERYRTEARDHEECLRAAALVNETKCFTSYERNFMSPVS